MQNDASKNVAIRQMNETAMMHYQAGRLTEAETIYRQILRHSPNAPDALYFTGMIALQSGNYELAADFISQAVAVDPSKPEYYHDLGVSLQNLGRLDEALHNYRQELKKITNWKAALHYLTRPLVCTAGLDLGSQHTSIRSQNSKQPTNLHNNILPHAAPAVPTASIQDSNLRATEYSAREAEKLRVMLIYPPPWKHGSNLWGMPFGVPRELIDRITGEDFQTITYGLLTIAAQAKRAGHEVSLYNLADWPWHEVVKLIAESNADVYGISAFTANRRGLGAISTIIRQYHPQAHITAGGPFVTALPLEALRYFQEIDTAVIGEGEMTFLDLLEHVGSGRTAVGIPGTAWRKGDEIIIGPVRPRINDLDSLASPFDYFTSKTVMTSRGCPSKCTFCGSFTTWGEKLRFLSVDSCLDTIRKALARLPVPFISIKDDTFTADRRRTIAICDAIVESKMNFIWSCDTRVDCLDDELLQKMRLAGCQMISLGVESGSPEILETMRKKTTPEMVLEATRSAQKYGMSVRYYMILLTRGETLETIQQSIDLIKAGRPKYYLFSPMSYYPGTEEWTMLCEKQGLTPKIFFNNDFKELSCATNRQREFSDLAQCVACDIGTIYGFNLAVDEHKAIVERLPHLHSVHVELANAYYVANRHEEALLELNLAEALGYPIGNIIDNQRACIALAQGDVNHALLLLEKAVQSYPDLVVTNNLKKLRDWTSIQIHGRGKLLLNDSVNAIDFSSVSIDSYCPA